MVFNSFNFALYLALVYGSFLLIPSRLKSGFLMVVSYLFYSFASVQSCILLLAVSLLCFLGGLLLRKWEGRPRRQQGCLYALLAVQIAALAYFKYFALLLKCLGSFFASLRSGSPEFVALLVPIGVSFFVFQGMSYLIDVYWGKPAEQNLPDFLLYMCFFPKVMMGPIERGEKLLPQIKHLRRFQFSYDDVRQALLLFAWGLFKKLVVAERLALYVNEVFGKPAEYAGIPVAAAIVLFAFQLYADFSGYTDMALAIGRLFGLGLTQNFDRPFYATNIQDFWRRWHISFSSWIGDYIFTPLRMALRSLGKLGIVPCLFITFILVGAWHGSTFIIFGMMHGLYMTVSTFTLRARDSWWEKHNLLGSFWLVASRRLATFVLVIVSFVFFRAETNAAGFAILGRVFQPGPIQLGLKRGLEGPELLIALAMVVLMEVVEMLIRSGKPAFSQVIRRPLWFRWVAYLTLLMLILCFGVFSNPQRFIYFDF